MTASRASDQRDHPGGNNAGTRLRESQWWAGAAEQSCPLIRHADNHRRGRLRTVSTKLLESLRPTPVVKELRALTSEDFGSQ